MNDIHHQPENIIYATEQYIVVIINCKSKKINPKLEPLYNEIIKFHSKANVYNGDNTVLDRRPGQIKIITTSSSTRKADIILIYGQYYEGKTDLPNDNKRKRLEWFQDALDEIAEIKDLRSIAFPTQIAKDGGGNWAQYYQAIRDFSQTIHLKNENIKVSIYENPTLESETSTDNQAPKKISLVNCLNLTEVVDLKMIKMNTQKIKLSIEKPSLLNRDSLANSVNKTRIKALQKEKESEKLMDLISSESTGPKEQNDDEISSDNYEANHETESPSKAKQTLNLTTESDDESENKSKPDSPTKPKISIKKEFPQKAKPKINLQKPSIKTKPEEPEEPEPKAVEEPEPKEVEEPEPEAVEEPELDQESEEIKRIYPETIKNPDWNTKSLSQVAQTELGGWSKEIFSLPDIQEILGDIDRELSQELEKHGEKIRFLPDFDNIFAAFRLSDWDQTRVVILGQDPYFANTNEAMGLSFSVPEGVKIPPSLRNIFKEIKDTYEDYEVPKNGDLTGWAKQGVLLLNSALTVRHKTAGSHMRIWKTLTDKIIELISKKKTTPVIFMLWGGHAKGKSKLIKNSKHVILTATHPSPLGANQGGWFGCGHFGESNIKLMESGQDPVDWGSEQLI